MNRWSLDQVELVRLARTMGLDVESSCPGDGARCYTFVTPNHAHNVSPVLRGAKEATIWIRGYQSGADAMQQEVVPILREALKVEQSDGQDWQPWAEKAGAFCIKHGGGVPENLVSER